VYFPGPWKQALVLFAESSGQFWWGLAPSLVHRRRLHDGLVELLLLGQRGLGRGGDVSLEAMGVLGSLEAGQRRLLLVGQLREGQLAALLRRYLLAVAQLVDVQGALQVEPAVTELAQVGCGQGGAAVRRSASPEADLEVVVVGAPVGAQQRSDVELGPTHAARVAGQVVVIRGVAAQRLQLQPSELPVLIVLALPRKLARFRGAAGRSLGGQESRHFRRLGLVVPWREAIATWRFKEYCRKMVQFH